MQHFFIAGAIGIEATGVFTCLASAQKKPKLELFDTHTCFFDPTRPEGVPWSGKGNKRLFRPTLPDEFKRVATKFVGHACEFETSMMLHLRPELVAEERRDAGELVPDQLDGVFISRDMRQRTREGCTGRPDLASAEKGERLFEGIVDRLDCLVNELLTQPLGTEYRQFVPDGQIRPTRAK